jgi:hypothetical protein
MTAISSPNLPQFALWERWARERPRAPIFHPLPPLNRPRRRFKARHRHGRASGTVRALIPWFAVLVLLGAVAAFFAGRGSGSISGPTLISDDIPALSRFVQSRIGHLLVPVKNSASCRRVLFSNDTGLSREAGQVSCDEPATPPVEQGLRSAGSADRLGALRDAFKR